VDIRQKRARPLVGRDVGTLSQVDDDIPTLIALSARLEIWIFGGDSSG